MRAPLVLVLLSLMSVASPAVAEVVRSGGAEVAALKAAGVPIVDVRRPDEWQQTGIVEGSHLLTFFDAKGRYDLDAWLQALQRVVGKDQPFVVICRSGGRSGVITRLLDEQLGYTRVHDASGGMLNWLKEGRPVVSP